MAALWNLDGEMLGSFGDSDFWIVPSKPDEGMMMRLLNAAETKHRNLGKGSSKKLTVRAPLLVTFPLLFPFNFIPSPPTTLHLVFQWHEGGAFRPPFVYSRPCSTFSSHPNPNPAVFTKKTGQCGGTGPNPKPQSRSLHPQKRPTRGNRLEAKGR